jgi:hypothetical protein
VLTRARRSAAALALEPHPGSKGQIMTHAQIAELDKHNRSHPFATNRWWASALGEFAHSIPERNAAPISRS